MGAPMGTGGGRRAQAPSDAPVPRSGLYSKLAGDEWSGRGACSCSDARGRQNINIAVQFLAYRSAVQS
jgi:hypothetical protein